MTDQLDLAALIAGAELDRATIENLKKADRSAMRKLLSQYLPADQVENTLGRIDALIRAADEKKE